MPPHSLPLSSEACLTPRRHAPLETREAREVAVEGDPFATVLDGERGEPGVRHARACRCCLPAQLLEDRPVPVAGLDDLAM